MDAGRARLSDEVGIDAADVAAVFGHRHRNSVVAVTNGDRSRRHVLVHRLQRFFVVVRSMVLKDVDTDSSALHPTVEG